MCNVAIVTRPFFLMYFANLFSASVYPAIVTYIQRQCLLKASKYLCPSSHNLFCLFLPIYVLCMLGWDTGSVKKNRFPMAMSVILARHGSWIDVSAPCFTPIVQRKLHMIFIRLTSH